MDVVYETTVSTDQKMFTSVFEEIAAMEADVIDATVGYIDEGALIKQWEAVQFQGSSLFHLGRSGRYAAGLEGDRGQVSRCHGRIIDDPRGNLRKDHSVHG